MLSTRNAASAFATEQRLNVKRWFERKRRQAGDAAATKGMRDDNARRYFYSAANPKVFDEDDFYIDIYRGDLYKGNSYCLISL